ncbi:MAG: phenylphosphate carboxylase subunit delta [Phycisphaerae bacterium]|nr:phenylphosphate carboxylase subunit delta [Phycisphaerae bacterium]
MNSEPGIKPIKLLCLDVDGVLTDGRISISDHGIESKTFHVRDGLAMKLWMSLGLEIAVITGRTSNALVHRLEELGVRILHMGVSDKQPVFREVLEQVGCEASEVAMLGDDLPDACILRLVGYPMAVQDASAEILKMVHYVTVRPGGHAAVREAIEHLLKRQDQWDSAIERFLLDG